MRLQTMSNIRAEAKSDPAARPAPMVRPSRISASLPTPIQQLKDRLWRAGA